MRMGRHNTSNVTNFKVAFERKLKEVTVIEQFIYFRYHMISISFFILQSKAVWDSVLQYEIALWGKLISHSL